MVLQDLIFQNEGVLSVVQFKTDFRNTLDYKSLSQAIKDKFLEIKEISDSGSVNNLKVVNNSGYYVFISDGDILEGAKQNRVINISVFIPPKSIIVIPVSCIEQGRWSYNSKNFSNADYTAPMKMRLSKAYDVNLNMKVHRNFNADQTNIWNKVSDYEELHSIKSESSDLSHIFSDKRSDFEKFCRKFLVKNDSNGLAIFINSDIHHLEIFNRSDIYEEYFSKILKGAYFDTCHLKNDKQSIKESEAKFKTLDFIDNLEEMKFDLNKSVGAGHEKRFESESITGFELIFNDKAVHLTGMNFKSNFN